MKNKLIETANYISEWLKNYSDKSNSNGFVIGISGGIDSALTSTLCAMTTKPVLCVEMPGKNQSTELSTKHIEWLKTKFNNVTSICIPIGNMLEETIKANLSNIEEKHNLTIANTASRLRMVTLYFQAGVHGYLVCGTGNKVEDFGIGFFTKYGDGGVDISPIGDLMKSEVKVMAKELGVIDEIIKVAPTDGLWNDGRTDEDQIGATYDELEWVMNYSESMDTPKKPLSKREKEVFEIYTKRHNTTKHKINPIPICSLEGILYDKK